MPLDLRDYMNEHIFMYSGDGVRAKLRVVKPMISDIVDIFGKDIILEKLNDQTIDVKVKANEESILQIAQRYAPDVIIVEPEELRRKIHDRLIKGEKVYKEDRYE